MKLAPLLLGTFLAATACAQIVGIQHYQAAPGGGAAGPGGGPAWVCTLPGGFSPSFACVTYGTAPDGGEGDPGLDPEGNAAFTTCDPVTNQGCDPGDRCVPDRSYDHYYCTSSPPNATPLCAACGSYPCAPGTFCVPTDLVCAQLCCRDADCAGAGYCDTTRFVLADGVGLCVQ